MTLREKNEARMEQMTESQIKWHSFGVKLVIFSVVLFIAIMVYVSRG